MQNSKEGNKEIEHFTKVFSYPLSLGISFRIHKEISTEFLITKHDFDFEALENFVEICKKHSDFQECLLESLVNKPNQT